MARDRTYDESEDDEKPRVCGGALFVKFLKKRRYSPPGSPPSPPSPPSPRSPRSPRSPWSPLSRKDQTSSLTSTSTYSFSDDDASKKSLYDPTKPHYCMPRQLDGAAAKLPNHGSKLDFRLLVEEAVAPRDQSQDLQPDFFGMREKPEESKRADDDTKLDETIVQFDPHLINNMKTNHLRSINERNELKKKPKTDHSFEPTSTNSSSEDVDTTLAGLHPTRSDQSKGQHVSKVHLMRKEMSSFREELNAVKKSLSSDFQSKHSPSEGDDNDWKETNAFVPEETSNDAFVEIKKNGANGSSDQELWKKIDMIQTEGTVDDSQCDSNLDDVWNETHTLTSKEQTPTGEKASSEKKYFKNDWNFNFHDNEKQNDTMSESIHFEVGKSTENEKNVTEPSTETEKSATGKPAETSTENEKSGTETPTLAGNEKNVPQSDKLVQENEKQLSENENQPPEQLDETSTSAKASNETSVVNPINATSAMETNESSLECSKENLSEGVNPTSDNTAVEAKESSPRSSKEMWSVKAKLRSDKNVMETKESSPTSSVEQLPERAKPRNKEVSPTSSEIGNEERGNDKYAIPTAAPTIKNSQKSELERLIAIHDILEREKAKSINRIDTDTSEFDEDLEIVRNLMKKYGYKTPRSPRSPRVGKLKPIHPAIDAPSDAWFHRHAVGSPRMQRKFEKPWTTVSDEQNVTDQSPRKSTKKRSSSFRENGAQTNGVKAVSWKNVNRVHMIEGDRPVSANASKGTTSKPIGKLADKIKFWEGNSPKAQ